jgi:PAS domain S-box-containing protein
MQNPQQNKKEIGLVLSDFVLLTLLGIGYKLFDLYHMREISTKTTQIYEHTLNVSTTVHSVQLAISKIHTTMKEIIASQTREELDGHIKEITELEQEVSKELPVILKNINDKNALKLVEETVLLFEICKPTRDRVIELVKENRREEAVAIAKSRGMDHVVALDAAVAQLFSYSQDQTHYFKAESDALLRQWTVIDLSLSLLMMLLFIYIAYSTINKLKQHYTQNRRLNSVLSVISNINKLIVREKDPQRLMTSSCHILTTNNVYGNAWIVFLNRDGTLNQVVSSDTSENFNAFRKRVDTGWTPLCIEKTVQSDKLYCSIENTAESCLDCPLRNRYDSKSAYNIQLVYNDRVYGYLTLSVDEHYYNNIDESTLLNDVADDISYALYNIETEKILTESEKRYRALFKSNRAVELIVDPQNGEIIDCNDKAVSYYGYAYKQMKTMHISDINILNPEDLALEMKQATEQQRDMFHFQHRLANGDVRDVEVYSGPIKIDDRELLYSIIFDVTDRLKLEHYKTEVEERYRFVVQAASDGIWDWDLLTNELYLSPSWKAMLGYHDDEMENAYGEWESRIHPDDIFRRSSSTFRRNKTL